MSRAVSASALDFGLCRRRLCQALYTPGPVRRLSLCAFERGLARPLPNKARARQTDLAWPRRPGATMSTSLGCSAAGTLSQALPGRCCCSKRKARTFRQARAEATAETFNHLPSRFAQPAVTALCIETSFP